MQQNPKSCHVVASTLRRIATCAGSLSRSDRIEVGWIHETAPVVQPASPCSVLRPCRRLTSPRAPYSGTSPRRAGRQLERLLPRRPGRRRLGTSNETYLGAPNDAAFFGTQNYNTGGGFVGGVIGYNVQAGPAVFGIEGDYHWSAITGRSDIINVGPPSVLDTYYTALRSSGDIKGRLGYADGATLWFVSGGAAVGDIQHRYNAGLAPPSVIASDTRWGRTIGAGVENMLRRTVGQVRGHLHRSRQGRADPVLARAQRSFGVERYLPHRQIRHQLPLSTRRAPWSPRSTEPAADRAPPSPHRTAGGRPCAPALCAALRAQPLRCAFSVHCGFPDTHFQHFYVETRERHATLL